MPKTLTLKDIHQIITLRKTGHSIPEIRRLTSRSNSTILKYIQGVHILPKYIDAWKIKQGGSKARSLIAWEESKTIAERLILPMQKRDTLIILSCLYWGEGNKKELNFINSDPEMIQTFVKCLKDIGVDDDSFLFTIRIYEDIRKESAILFWSSLLKIPKEKIRNVNVLQGKKSGKLQYGMCRVRVKKGAKYFKIIMSIVDLLKSKI